MEAETPSRSEHRAAIKKTVERVAPQVEIDQTKVLTDEELEILRKKWEEQKADQRLAEKEGRAGLKERLAKAAGQARATGRLEKPKDATS